MTVEAVEELVPRGHVHRRITTVVEKLRELDSVCVKIQSEQCTLADIRLLVNACAVKYPVADYLATTAAIIHSPLFESAIVKLHNDLPMSADETREVEGFVQPLADQPAGAPKKVDIATSVVRKSKKPRLAGQMAVQYYPLLTCAPPTRNTCERLFSECKLVLTSLRASTPRANVETAMFLYANRGVWNCATLLSCTEDCDTAQAAAVDFGQTWTA
ncbi:hypothetical protein PF007_g20495 [Phytophthora fragariae]|uniref:HAT C-terminal dimerisation domain-containing protein n=2 Tax=Phytophthora fragariae TaxID=53985 RepID=A0A6A3R4W2_9STRA|nr:hypothetical protein PF009_g17764 [Phytophthora fragariae]KAE9087134.1 hypothetical protein PF007_g20495 [Phytophthora fragariae]